MNIDIGADKCFLRNIFRLLCIAKHPVTHLIKTMLK